MAASIRMLFVLTLFSLRKGTSAQEQEKIRPGRYMPELHGERGTYIPDYSGKYRHVHNPYDGGYGDRGEPYDRNFNGIIRQTQQEPGSADLEQKPLQLGSDDHLRFMIDFNYNGTGWQIIQFEWIRDGVGVDQRKYNYVNENQLWQAESQPQLASESYSYEQPQQSDDINIQQEQQTKDIQEPTAHVHVTGENGHRDYQVSYDSAALGPGGSEANLKKDNKHLKAAINEVLEYIQQRILPTLN